MIYHKQQLESRRVELDGNDFISCHFIRCKLVFQATAWVRFDDCLFTECEWVFDGNAELALEFLAWMYHGLSKAGPELVEAVFDNIKQGDLAKAAIRQQTVGV